MTRFDVVVAADRSWGIGREGALPWPKLTGDLQHFRKITSATKDETLRNAIVMGRKTWESAEVAGKPLPRRLNIVVSRGELTLPEGVVGARSLNEALAVDREHDRVESVFVVGGATQGDRHALRVFENPGHGNRWVEVTLVGSTSNRSAIGTRITVTVANADGTQRAIHRTVGSGGSFGASPLRQHIGLGKAERIVSVETWWPKSGVRQRFTDVPLDKWIEARESATTFTVRDRLPRPTPSAP